MADYIDREVLLKQIALAASRTALGETTLDRINSIEIVGIIKDMPTADVRPERHGRWNTGYFHDRVCSCCLHPDNDLDDYAHNYCPNCGVKMGVE